MLTQAVASCVAVVVSMQMRRELAAAIRDVGKLAGHDTVLTYMVKLVQTYHGEMKRLIREAGAPAAVKLSCKQCYADNQGKSSACVMFEALSGHFAGCSCCTESTAKVDDESCSDYQPHSGAQHTKFVCTA